MRKNKRTRKQRKNIFFKIVGVLSTIIFLIFSIVIFFLDMIPFKYLMIFYIIFGLLYLIMILFTFFRRIKRKLLIIAFVFFLIFGVIFTIGIKYISDTINFFDIIDNDLSQKEVYYLMLLEENEYKKVNELANKNIGIYSSSNSTKASNILNKKVNVKFKEYESVTELFEDLKEGKIDGILINESTKNLLTTELSDLDIKLKEIYKVYISIEKKDIVKVVDVTRKPFNIYVAGGDAYGSIDNVTNTDVNMIVTVDPVNKKLLLTSIPRDYYVNLPSFGENAYDKLTHAGYYGIEESVKSVEKLLDIEINYYVKVNFSTIEGIVDAIGGVDVNSDMAFCVTTTGVCVKKGMNHLNGNQALLFARERKSFKDGDIQRVKNQQKVLQSVVNKFTSSTTLVTNFSKILDSVSSSISINMDTKSINKLVKMQLSDMREWKIESQNLTGINYSSSNTYTFPGIDLYVMKKDEDSIKKATKKIDDYFNVMK